MTSSSVPDHSATTATALSHGLFYRDAPDGVRLGKHPMRRIVIVGSYGAGKTTLAAALGPLLGLEVHHMDALRWQPGWRLRPLNEWHEILGEIVACDAWIVEGNFEKTLEPRLRRADTVILLDFPMWLSLWRLVRRRLRGGNRPDLPPGLKERLNFRTLTLVWDYRRRTRPQILRQVERSRSGRHVITLRRPKEVTALIGDLRCGVELSRLARD